MIINQASIREAFSAFNTVFSKAFSETEAQYTKIPLPKIPGKPVITGFPGISIIHVLQGALHVRLCQVGT